MTNITKQKARKEWKCDRCGKTIAIGDEYNSYRPAFRTPVIRCMAHTCRIRQSQMTSSDKMQRLLEIGEELEDMGRNPGPEDLIAAAEDAVGTVEEVSQEYEEGADNIEQYFTSGTDASQEMRSNAEELESWQSEIEGHRDTLQSAIDDEPEFDSDDEPEETDFDTDDAYATAVTEWEAQKTAHERWQKELDDATNELQDALGSMPI